MVVFPTETVYGLGCLASSQDAVHRLISAKGRRSGHALPVAISG
ncbi:MAG: Sua5/YciO/YrdC/YwlC family protein, partial [Thermoguttaceae bacterium]|nr:Sua5/YciO/YrdC/YwlC family protein [Thermoguttaceae bacterium]